MVDVVIAGTTSAAESRDALHGPFWLSPSVGYVVLLLTNDFDLAVFKTSDSGATWTEQDSLNSPQGNAIRSNAAWYDRETPGNNGTLIHLAYLDSTLNQGLYVAFDTADDTYGTIRVVDGLVTSSTSDDTDVGVTVSKSGRVYMCVRADFEEDAAARHSMTSSNDLFATDLQAEDSPYSADEEVVKLYPGSAADEDDICAVVFDAINQDLEFWKYDRSGTSWGVTVIDASILVTGAEARNQKGFYDAAIRHSDEHILVAYWNDRDVATGDLRTVDITQATPTITQEGDIHQSDDSFCAGLLINQQNDDVYVAYLGSDAGDEVQDSAVVCYFKLSVNGMTDWGTEQTYGIENANLRIVRAGHTVGDDGGRVMPAWYSESITDLLVNDGNDVEIAAVAAAGDALIGANMTMGPQVIPIPTQVSGY